MTSVTSSYSSHVVSAASTQALPPSSKQSSTSNLPNVKVFDKEPPKDFTGIVPAYFFKIIKGQEDGVVAGCVKLLNSVSLKTKSLNDIIKAYQVACVVYDQGVAKRVDLNHRWVKVIVEHKVSKIMLSNGGPEFLAHEDMDVGDLTDEYYTNMAQRCVRPLMKA